jgi:DinB family protein
MAKLTIGRPETSEYTGYNPGYVHVVPGEDILGFLEQQLDEMLSLLRGLSEVQGNYQYESGKWTVKELLGHVIDTERVLAYRALTFARNDSAALPGFDQNPWAQHAKHANVALRDLVDEFESVRRSTIHLFRNLDSAAWMRQGLANNKPATVRAQAYVIAGHAKHHLEILKSRYLSV